MPRASSQASKLLKGGFGLQDGIIKIIDAKYKMVQHVTKEQKLTTPFVALSLEYGRSDAAGVLEDEEKTFTKDCIIQWAKKNPDWNENDATEQGDDYDIEQFLFDGMKFHPGKAEGPEDSDPEDLGTEIGTEGNSLWAASADLAPFADSEYGEFLTALEKKGWKPEVNDQSFAPNYIGTVFQFRTETVALRPGQTLKEGQKPPTRWVIEQFHIKPYEQKKGGKSSAPKPAAKGTTTAAAGKSNGSAKPAPAPAPEQGEGYSEAVVGGFTAAVEKLMNSPAKAQLAISKNLTDGESVALTDFQRAVVNEVMVVKVNGKSLDPKTQKELMSAVKAPGFIEENNGGTVIVDREEGTVTGVSA